jgi:glycosyltransferase involved in cell wall biosynthesis
MSIFIVAFSAPVCFDAECTIHSATKGALCDKLFGHSIAKHASMIIASFVHERKGVELLVATFCGLRRTVVPFKLVIVGSDEGHLHVLRLLAKKT